MNIFTFLINIIIFLTTFYVFYKISFIFDLLDREGSRKIHKGSVPLIGGILIYLSSFFTILLSPITVDNTMMIVFYISSLLVLVGAYDDIYNLSPYKRLIIQILTIGLIINAGLSISELKSNTFTIDLGIVGYVFTFFCLVAIINAFNFIDGIDGLCSISFLIPVLYLYFTLNETLANNLLILLSINVIFFLIFNLGLFPNKKIFLGDSGSTFLGFILGFYLVYLSKNNYIDSFFVPWLIALPIFDLLRVIIFRLKNKLNPAEPDLIHVHHILFKRFNSNFKSLIILVVLIFIFIFIGKFINDYFSKLSIPLYLISFIFYYFAIGKVNEAK